MNNPTFLQTLVKVCNSYQEIIISLDKSLDMIAILAVNDNEIITVVGATKAEAGEKLKEVQKLINYLTEAAGINALNQIDNSVKH